MPEHSKTPWESDGRQGVFNRSYGIAHFFSSRGVCPRDPAEAIANAEFAVLAVNLHDQLVDACSAVREDIYSLLQDGLEDTDVVEETLNAFAGTLEAALDEDPNYRESRGARVAALEEALRGLVDYSCLGLRYVGRSVVRQQCFICGCEAFKGKSEHTSTCLITKARDLLKGATDGMP